MENEKEETYMIEVNGSNLMRFENIMNRWTEYSTNDIMEVLLDCFEKHEKEDYPMVGLKLESTWLCNNHLEEVKKQGYFISVDEVLQNFKGSGIGCDVADCNLQPINWVMINKKFWGDGRSMELK